MVCAALWTIRRDGSAFADCCAAVAGNRLAWAAAAAPWHRHRLEAISRERPDRLAGLAVVLGITAAIVSRSSMDVSNAIGDFWKPLGNDGFWRCARRRHRRRAERFEAATEHVLAVAADESEPMVLDQIFHRTRIVLASIYVPIGCWRAGRCSHGLDRDAELSCCRRFTSRYSPRRSR